MPGINFDNSLYVGNALNGAPDTFIQEITGLKKDLESRGFNVLEYRGLNNGTPAEIYAHDNGLVRNCTGMLAVFSEYRSPGLVGEVQTAALEHKAILGVVIGESPDLESAYLRGLFELTGQPLVEVDSVEEIAELVVQEFTVIRNVLQIPRGGQ